MIGGSDYKPDSDVAGSNSDSNSEINKEAAQKEAAKAVMRAIKSGDSDMLSEALNAHYEACNIMSPDEEE